MVAMARMKGNRGTHGFQLPPVEVPISFGDEQWIAPVVDAPRHRRWRLVLLVGLAAAILVASIGGAAWLVSNQNDGPLQAEPTEPVARSSPTPPLSPTAAPTLATTRPIAATASTAVPPTVAPTPTATATSTTSPTPAPVGPPGVRTRYVIQTGDACEVIRQRFQFANRDFENFQVAMGALSGRIAAERCVMRQGQVVCIPTQDDLARLNALVKDENCLAGP